MSEFLPPQVMRWLLAAVIAAASAIAAGHALLNKREPRAALGWIAVCLVFPAAGPLLYYVFGINRIRTRAKRMHAEDPEQVSHRASVGAPEHIGRPGHVVPVAADDRAALAATLRASDLVTGLPLTAGNTVTPLHSGDEAYPAIVAAIRDARRHVYLASYIFDPGRTATTIISALRQAVERGVRVRVLVDGFGELYGRPRISKLLRRAGIVHARFLPPRVLPPQLHINLRDHRKILVADGTVGFTGGMNIRDCQLTGHPDPHIDLHARVAGPAVEQLEQVFCDDWEFVTGERLPRCETPVPSGGGTHARIIVDGPNEDLDKLSTILIAAVASAVERVWIVTPYFLPPRELIGVMKAAALRGVDVSVLLPLRNNLPPLHWAARNTLWELLEWGVRVFYQPPPFAHTKLLILDRHYLQFGSANLDPRSLRLNFELSLEVVDANLNHRMGMYFEALRGRAERVDLGELEARPLWMRARDATAWLFSPYL